MAWSVSLILKMGARDSMAAAGPEGTPPAEDTQSLLGKGPAPHSSSWMATAWLISQARMRKNTGEGKGGKRLSDSNISKKNSVLCNRASGFTGGYYKRSNIFKSMTKEKHTSLRWMFTLPTIYIFFPILKQCKQ